MASSFLRFLDHTRRRTTIGRTPLDEWSARCRDLYLITHNTHNRQHSHAPGEIRTHYLSRRAAADLRLRPHSHWDRLLKKMEGEIQAKLPLCLIKHTQRVSAGQPTNHTNKQTNRTLKAQTYASFGPFSPSYLLDTLLNCDVEPEDYNGDCAYANGFPVLGCGTINGNIPFEWRGGREAG